MTSSPREVTVRPQTKPQPKAKTMISEAMETLRKLHNDAATPKTVPKFEGQSPTTAQWLHPNGSVVTVDLEPPPRKHKFTTLDSFLDAIYNYCKGPPSLWVQMETVYAILDDDDDDFRRSVLTLSLAPSLIFDALSKIANGRSLTHKEFCFFLAHDLATATIEPEGFRNLVRSIQFTQHSSGQSDVTSTTKNTMGRSVQQEAKAATALPETVIVAFEPWPASAVFPEPFLVRVACTFSADPAEECFRLMVRPGEIQAALSKSLDAMCAEIRRASQFDCSKIYAGSPN